MLQVVINGQAHQFEEPLSIETLLQQLQISQDHGVAVALNDTIVLKSKFSQTFIKDGDRLEIIHATAGG
ncbi:MAG: sulfur carrier protein ThiS [bacterium]